MAHFVSNGNSSIDIKEPIDIAIVNLVDDVKLVDPAGPDLPETLFVLRIAL